MGKAAAIPDLGAKESGDVFDAGQFVPAFHDAQGRLQLQASGQQVAEFFREKDDVCPLQLDRPHRDGGFTFGWLGAVLAIFGLCSLGLGYFGDRRGSGWFPGFFSRFVRLSGRGRGRAVVFGLERDGLETVAVQPAEGVCAVVGGDVPICQDTGFIESTIGKNSHGKNQSGAPMVISVAVTLMTSSTVVSPSRTFQNP